MGLHHILCRQLLHQKMCSSALAQMPFDSYSQEVQRATLTVMWVCRLQDALQGGAFEIGLAAVALVLYNR